MTPTPHPSTSSHPCAAEVLVRAVLRGRVRPFGRGHSAIDKQAVHGPVAVGPQGLDGDEQADLRVHGGEEKALHACPWVHHAAWARELPGAGRWGQPGAFGENLAVEGIDEAGVCVGDRWSLGSAVVEVSQGRQPCWKLAERFGVPDMALRVQDSGRSGWYLRVIEPGQVAAGDTMRLLSRPHPQATVAWLMALIRDRVTDPAVLDAVLALPLTAPWRRLFERRREAGQVEDWGSRLDPRP